MKYQSLLKMKFIGSQTTRSETVLKMKFLGFQTVNPNTALKNMDFGVELRDKDFPVVQAD
jgi:hypothetical protein